jgi:hypothetical protein
MVSYAKRAARPQEQANSGGPRSRNDDAGAGDPAALQIVVSGDDVVEPVGAARADIEDASLNCIEQVRSRSFQLRAMLCVDEPKYVHVQCEFHACLCGL